MELRHLRYFVAVAEELSFTRAAQKLRVAQPALSRQIRDLEEELGASLFERNRRNVSLTAGGAAFLVEARALLEQAAQAIKAAQGAPAAAVNIGYVYGLFHSVVPPVIDQVRQAMPNVPIHLFDLSATEQAEKLANGDLDAGFIGFAYEAEDRGLAKQKIGSCEFIAALPKAHRAARRASVSLRDLSEDFFFMISEATYPGASRLVQRACDEAGFRPKILQSAERGFTLLNLVAGNCGVALVPESLRALPHDGVVFRPLSKRIADDLFFAWGRGVSPELKRAFQKVLPPR